ncbi:Uncharacterized protein Rs2_01853 [Raphanus sativus]|nr:Uncharacterized protein Rs2_01853 [Raphanus sativus]
MDLQLPSREVIEVELEYEKLDKHCFLCKSLSHEDEACPYRPTMRTQGNERRDLGISQHNTLVRIDESRRRQDERKYARNQNVLHQGDARWTNMRINTQRSNSSLSREISSYKGQGQSTSFEENRRLYNDRRIARQTSPPLRSPPRREWHEKSSMYRNAHGSQDRTHGSQDRTPPQLARPIVSRSSPVIAVSSSQSQQSPAVAPHSGSQRPSAVSRLSDSRSGGKQLSEERVPAKERLSVNTSRTSQAGVLDSAPAKNQQPLSSSRGEALLPVELYTSPHTTTPSVFNSNRLGPCERSPIRTLSEDRVHVSLRLGPLLPESEEDSVDAAALQLRETRAAKAAGKELLPLLRDKRGPVTVQIRTLLRKGVVQQRKLNPHPVGNS